MKKHLHYIIIAAVFISGTLSLNAQTTLTAGGFTPQAGESFTLHAFPYMAAGNSGANITWDFSTVSSTASAQLDYVTPASTPNAASFPSSNLAMNQSTVYGYYETSASSFSQSGIVSSGVLIQYSDPEKMMSFPFTYNDTYTDNFAATFTSGVDFNRSGSITVTADGYGSLILPYGTVNNVLRVRIVETYQDDYNIGGPQTINYNSSIYAWYKEGTHYPIMNISSIISDQPQTFQSATYLDQADIASGVDELENTVSMGVFPNPAKENATVYFTLDQPEKVQLALYNSIGQVVEVIEHNQVAGGMHSYTINTANHAPGIYTLKIIAGDKAGLKKISIL